MFDIGWTELLVIACVAIIVVGPKDLPRMLRSLGQTMGQLRRMSREFQSTFNDALREAEKQADVADMKKQVEDAANFNPLGDLKKSIEEDAGKIGAGLKDTVGSTAKPSEPVASGTDTVTKTASGPEPATSAPGNPTLAETSPVDLETAAAGPETKPAARPVTEDMKA